MSEFYQVTLVVGLSTKIPLGMIESACLRAKKWVLYGRPTTLGSTNTKFCVVCVAMNHGEALNGYIKGKRFQNI